MRVLFMEIPSRDINNSPPFGVLYAAGAVLRCNHEAKIINFSKEKLSFSSMSDAINNYKPDLIGLGGITSSYKNLKTVSGFLKGHYPEIPVIVGGVVSSISELLLINAGADIVVHGEGETTIPFLIKYYQKEIPIEKIPGISYLLDGVIQGTQLGSQIASLDDIPFPPYDLLDMDKYLSPTKNWIDHYFKYDNKAKTAIMNKLTKTPYMSQIITARGCTHRCIFCYRHLKGIRQHSVDYVIEHIKYLKEKYNVGFFQFCDELTTSNKKWVFNFCDRLEKEHLDINFVVLSARVDTINDDMLRRLKEAGCVMINCGYESGSDIILKEIGKGVTREQNINAAFAIKKAGIINIPEIMIGFPSESDATIDDTIEFLRIIDRFPVSLNYVLPFPQTPLWQFCLEKGLIKNVEEFILNYEDACNFKVNLTQFPDKRVQSWMAKIRYEIERPIFIKNRDYISLLKSELKKRVPNEKLWKRVRSIRNKLQKRN